VPNSPAIPLPSAVHSANFRCRPTGKIIPKVLIRLLLFLLSRGRVSTAERCFSPAIMGKDGVGQTCGRDQALAAGASTSTLTPRAVTVSSRQVSSSTGTPLAIRSAIRRPSLPVIHLASAVHGYLHLRAENEALGVGPLLTCRDVIEDLIRSAEYCEPLVAGSRHLRVDADKLIKLRLK
jgi:hypothetical protein